MFPLVKYFSLISAAVVGLAMIVVTIVLTKTTTDQLVEERQNANVALTQVFSNSVWRRFRGHVKTSAELDGSALRDHARSQELLSEVRHLMQGLSVVKVKVYALNGNTVFSTEPAQMGDSKRENRGFVTARDGRPISEYSNRAKFSAFENEIFDVDVVSSYVPIYGADGRVEAVFEVYDNVTASLQKMGERKNLIIAFVGGLFGLLYLALLLIVRRAAKILQHQHNQILFAKADLEQTNDQLFQRSQQLEAAQRTLVQQERLATLGELTATVSHELRNPLAAIRSSVHLAIKRTEGHDLGIERSLERAERNVVRCDGIISDLLGFASEPVCQPQRIGGDDWLGTTLDDMVVAEDVTLVRDLSAPGAELCLVPEQMRRAVVNVFENAMQGLAETSNITRPTLTVRSLVQGDNYAIAFTDTGAGMDGETVAKAFEPLFSTKAYGCGLGLATVKKIVESHNGAIDIESQVGVGTTVTMSLPLSHEFERAA